MGRLFDIVPFEVAATAAVGKASVSKSWENDGTGTCTHRLPSLRTLATKSILNSGVFGGCRMVDVEVEVWITHLRYVARAYSCLRHTQEIDPPADLIDGPNATNQQTSVRIRN